MADRWKEKYAGKTFGMLTALEPRARAGKERKWLFKCTCGSHVLRRISDVTQGKTKSCGCLGSPGAPKGKRLPRRRPISPSGLVQKGFSRDIMLCGEKINTEQLALIADAPKYLVSRRLKEGWDPEQIVRRYRGAVNGEGS